MNFKKMIAAVAAAAISVSTFGIVASAKTTTATLSRTDSIGNNFTLSDDLTKTGQITFNSEDLANVTSADTLTFEHTLNASGNNGYLRAQVTILGKNIWYNTSSYNRYGTTFSDSGYYAEFTSGITNHKIVYTFTFNDDHTVKSFNVNYAESSRTPVDRTVTVAANTPATDLATIGLGAVTRSESSTDKNTIYVSNFKATLSHTAHAAAEYEIGGTSYYYYDEAQEKSVESSYIGVPADAKFVARGVTVKVTPNDDTVSSVTITPAASWAAADGQMAGDPYVFTGTDFSGGPVVFGIIASTSNGKTAYSGYTSASDQFTVTLGIE